MPTTKQDQDFAKLMEENVDSIKISTSVLDYAIEFIADNFEPDDIYSEDKLRSWAESNGYVK